MVSHLLRLLSLEDKDYNIYYGSPSLVIAIIGKIKLNADMGILMTPVNVLNVNTWRVHCALLNDCPDMYDCVELYEL